MPGEFGRPHPLPPATMPAKMYRYFSKEFLFAGLLKFIALGPIMGVTLLLMDSGPPLSPWHASPNE